MTPEEVFLEEVGTGKENEYDIDEIRDIIRRFEKRRDAKGAAIWRLLLPRGQEPAATLSEAASPVAFSVAVIHATTQET